LPCCALKLYLSNYFITLLLNRKYYKLTCNLNFSTTGNLSLTICHLVESWLWTLYIYFPCIREIWKFVHPRKVIFPELFTREKSYFPREIWLIYKFSYFPYAREMNVLFHQANVLVNSAKWNLLTIFVYKIIISEHFWSYLY
jgi:hypothetical protein